MGAFREVEAAFEVAAGASLPSLVAVPGVAAVRTDQPVELVATYLDTAAGDLIRAGITLRRRSGGADAGWHLKVPTGRPEGHDLAHAGPRDRTEHRAADAASVPVELLDLVRARLRGQGLVPVAVLTARRTVHHLLDPDGREMLEVADDEVLGEPTGGTPRRWREWEVELRDGDAEQLEAAVGLLAAAGGAGPRPVGKLVRTLGEVRTVSTSPRSGGAGEVVRAYLAAQVEQLLSLEPVVRAAAPGPVLDDAVHEARVATRRLRAGLSAGRGLLEPADSPTDPAPSPATVAGPLLRELGRLLGAVRDPAVELETYRARATLEPGDDSRAAVRLLAADRRAASRRALRALRQFLGSASSDLLWASLVALADSTPAGPRAARPARAVLRRHTRSRARRLATAWDEADALPSGADRDGAVHAARKRARHARYAAEIAASVVGRPARRSARRFQHVQDLLGAQHDTVVRRATLERLATRPGAPAFVLGRWHAGEQADGAAAERAGERAVRRALTARRLRWLT